MVMVACYRLAIAWPFERVLSRCLNGDIHHKPVAKILRGSTKRFQHVPALLAGGRKNPPDEGTVDGSLLAAETPRYLRLDLFHSNCQFSYVVGGGNLRIADKKEDGITVIPQASQQIVCLTPLCPSPSAL